MELYTIHNPRHEKILRTTCAPFNFEKYSKQELRDLVKEMRIKMKEWNGIGLAAPQIGRNEQFFVAQPPDGGKFYAIFNPKITKAEGGPMGMEEGCLSVPGKYGMVPRYEKVMLTGQGQSGKKIKIKAWGILAHIFQHEYDHLQGTLYIDKTKKTYQFATSARLKKKAS